MILKDVIVVPTRIDLCVVSLDFDAAPRTLGSCLTCGERTVGCNDDIGDVARVIAKCRCAAVRSMEYRCKTVYIAVGMENDQGESYWTRLI
jgi:hypothetical protein